MRGSYEIERAQIRYKKALKSVAEKENQDSALEATFDYYWRILAPGAEKPVKQFKFHPERKWKIDRAWPDKKIAVELDGGAGAGYGRPVHCHNCGYIVRYKDQTTGKVGKEIRLPYPSHTGKGAERDREKGNALQATGWRLLRFSSAQLKEDPDDCIKQIIEALQAAECKDEPDQPKLYVKALTSREAQILQYMCEGKTWSAIGFALGISDRTVGVHINHIRDKLGAPNQTSAVAKAVALGLIDIKRITTSPE